MNTTPTDAELRAAWKALRMVGNFDSAMRNPAVHRVVLAAARAMRTRGLRRFRFALDPKRRAANDNDE